MKPLPIVYDADPAKALGLVSMDTDWRGITDHLPPPAEPAGPAVARTLNGELAIAAIDLPGPGGANHSYLIGHRRPDGALVVLASVQFQKGGILEAGVNGVSNEALLAVVADRLRCFEQGRFACKENAFALAACHDALDHLHARTQKRLARGVEGRQLA